MGYNVQRAASIASCLISFNKELIKKFKAYNNKSIVDIMTDNFIVKEIEEHDFDRINKYWDAMKIDDLKDWSNLGDIPIKEWELIEDTLQ